jgi:sugar phosphate isomerase/epimerase
MLAALSAAALTVDTANSADAPSSGPLKVSVFSKHFQWTDCQETAAIAKEAGFDGVDLTVRRGGHVLPERVEDDLPKAAEIIRGAGLELPMITAGIVDTHSPKAEAILRTASRLGIRHYRWGGFEYSASPGIPEQLAAFKERAKDLAGMNAGYNICAMYHTHSGVNQVGASIWDLWYILKDFDNRYIGVNYDIGHATVEGGYGGWVHSARLTAPMMRGVAVKDFRWGTGKQGWAPQWCAPGRGMVALDRFFAMLKAQRFAGPLQLHFEYPEIGAASEGKAKLDISRDQFTAVLRRDLAYVRNLLHQAQLA